jgi:large subunit ribosomal protein L35
MPKLKTNRSANKRYRITKNNKVIRKKAFKSHILEKNLQSKNVDCLLVQSVQMEMQKQL